LIEQRKKAAINYSKGGGDASQLIQFQNIDASLNKYRQKFKELVKEYDEEIKTKDSDYVFLTFILNYLPHGLIGLLIAVIFSAAMSSTSSELNSLASTTSIDFYKRILNKDVSDDECLKVSKYLTLAWGIIAIIFAIIANNAENLIEAVNIIGSLFYGTILGIFIVAFFFKRILGNAVFVGALLAEAVVLTCHFLNQIGVLNIGYLWYNVIGCVLTVVFGFVFQLFFRDEKI